MVDEVDCPLFLCPGALPVNFKDSKALKQAGALVSASGVSSEEEEGPSDIDDQTPLSCYYESSSDSEAISRPRHQEPGYRLCSKCNRNRSKLKINGTDIDLKEGKPYFGSYLSCMNCKQRLIDTSSNRRSGMKIARLKQNRHRQRYRPFGKNVLKESEKPKGNGNSSQASSSSKSANTGIGEIQAFMSLWQGIK